MKKILSKPLLRVAAMGSGLTGCGLAGAGPEVEPASHADSRVHLRGSVRVPQPKGQAVYIEVITSAGKRRIDLQESTDESRRFHLTDADLGGLEVPEESLELVAYVDTDRSFKKIELTVPRRSTGLELIPGTPYIPPVPASEIPTPDAVRAMPPAEPPQADSHLDLQGVVVFDNRFGIPQRISISIRGKTGVVHKQFTPSASPFRFRIQDSDASDGHAFTGGEVELWSKVRYGTLESTAIETTVKNVPVKTDGLVVQPLPYEPPSPAPLPLTSVEVSIEGVVMPPPEGKPTVVTLRLNHALGTIERVLSTDQWPIPFRIDGPEFKEIPVLSSTKTLTAYILVDTEEGVRYYQHRDLAFQSTGVVFEPALPLDLLPPGPDTENPKLEEPVYGNTKGSRYDDGVLPTLAPEPDR